MIQEKKNSPLYGVIRIVRIYIWKQIEVSLLSGAVTIKSWTSNIYVLSSPEVKAEGEQKEESRWGKLPKAGGSRNKGSREGCWPTAEEIE